MPLTTTRRTVSAWLCGMPALMVAAEGAGAQEIPREWGELWQPRLPARERHPSLYYDASDRDRMRARITMEPWKSWWDEMQGTAARSNTAFRWWITGDEKLAVAARADLLGARIFRQEPQGYLEPSSLRLADYIAAYDLLASWRGLSPDDHRAIRNKIAAEVDYYYGILSGGARGGANFGNQRTLAASALGIAALALCEFTGGAHGPAQWLALALHEIRREENFRFFREGGEFVQGNGYINYLSVVFLPFAIAYERASGKLLLDEPRLRESLVFAAYQMMSGGDTVPWGTSELWNGIPVLALVANRRYGRETAPLFTWCFKHTLRPHFFNRHIAIAHYENLPAGPMPPASRVFAKSHTAVFRDDWDKRCVSVWFTGKDPDWWDAAAYNSFSHGDCGTFFVAMAGEILATDSGYDHWKSKTYFDAKSHNVLLIDGHGPTSQTTAVMSNAETSGPVRRATVTSKYQGCTVRRTLAQVRGRYIVVADRIITSQEHEYTWQVRSACSPDAAPTRMNKRDVTWPGASFTVEGDLASSRTQLTTVVPPFANLSLAKSSWMPSSALPEFKNQAALAQWRAAATSGLFVLLPNSQDHPELKWEAGDGQSVTVTGDGFADAVSIGNGELQIVSSDRRLTFACAL